MTWSPLSCGILTGKYEDGIPVQSRAALKVGLSVTISTFHCDFGKKNNCDIAISVLLQRARVYRKLTHSRSCRKFVAFPQIRINIIERTNVIVMLWCRCTWVLLTLRLSSESHYKNFRTSSITPFYSVYLAPCIAKNRVDNSNSKHLVADLCNNNKLHVGRYHCNAFTQSRTLM